MLLGILLLGRAYMMRDTIAAALPQTPEQNVRQVWQRAAQISRYAYNSTILQTTHPAPRLENIGRHPYTEPMTLAGQIDRRQATMLAIMPPLQHHPIDDPPNSIINTQYQVCDTKPRL